MVPHPVFLILSYPSIHSPRQPSPPTHTCSPSHTLQLSRRFEICNIHPPSENKLPSSLLLCCSSCCWVSPAPEAHATDDPPHPHTHPYPHTHIHLTRTSNPIHTPKLCVFSGLPIFPRHILCGMFSGRQALLLELPAILGSLCRCFPPTGA